MSTPLRVLVVEDLEDDALLIMRALRRGGYEPAFERVDTPQAMHAALEKRDWDLVIADYSMPHFSGLAALALLRETGVDLPFIIVSGTIGEDVAVMAMKSGAHDYVMKDKLARLGPAVQRELEEAQVRLARRQAEELLRIRERFLECLAEVSQRLLRVESVGCVLTDALQRLGEAAQVCRVYLFENHLGREEGLLCSQRYEWSAPGIGLQMGSLLPENFSYAAGGFERWMDVLGADEVVAGRTVDLPERECAALESQNVHSLLVIPLFVSDQWYGFIGFADQDREREWQRVEIDLLRAAASDIASAIEREQAERQSHALAEAAAVLTSTLDFEQVLDRILEQASRVVPHDAANIMLIQGERTHSVRWRGYAPFGAEEHISKIVFCISQVPNFRQMMETKEPMVIPDTTKYPGWVSGPAIRWLRSYAAAPIIVRGQVIGFLNVDSATPGFFTSAHAKTLKTFADHVAAAIENARLFASEQQRTAALARALEQQRELDRLKSEFIQNVSHELRTPLALTRGYAELLESGALGELQPQQKEPVRIITRRIRTLAQLVDGLTTILTTESKELKREQVDLANLVCTLLNDFQVVAEQAGLTLVSQISPALPPISGNPNHLRQVLDNLLSNACKFTPPGGKVAVRLGQRGDSLVLEVADTGIGIPEDQLDRVFDRFYQVDGSATRRYEGTGLGLALVKEVVKAHSGQVSVQSQLGQGSIFQVRLPLAPHH